MARVCGRTGFAGSLATWTAFGPDRVVPAMPGMVRGVFRLTGWQVDGGVMA